MAKLDFKSMIISYFMFITILEYFGSLFVPPSLFPVLPNLNSLFLSTSNAYALAIKDLGGYWSISFFGYTISLVFIENAIAYTVMLFLIEIYSVITFIINMIIYFAGILNVPFILIPYPLNDILKSLFTGSLVIAFITSFRVLQTSMSW